MGELGVAESVEEEEDVGVRLRHLRRQIGGEARVGGRPDQAPLELGDEVDEPPALMGREQQSGRELR